MSSWAMIAKCSQDLEDRDSTTLRYNSLLRTGEVGGRRTHYELAL